MLILLILLASPVFASPGIPFTVVGTTSPEALVTVRVPKLTLSKPVVADEEGRFIVTFDDVPPGVYELFLSATKDGSSNETSQLVGIPDSPAVSQVTLSEINLPLTPVEPIKEEIADLNKDGRVNLVDASILMYWWQRSNPQKGDFNKDGVVDLKDFSLMLSRWTN